MIMYITGTRHVTLIQYTLLENKKKQIQSRFSQAEIKRISFCLNYV